MTVNALHNMVQDNYDRDELSSFFELTLYHTISWWIDVANDIPPRNLYINKQGMDMYDYLNSVNSYLDFMFQDLDFLHLEEMYSLYKKNPKILEEFLHIDIEQYIELMPRSSFFRIIRFIMRLLRNMDSCLNRKYLLIPVSVG